VIGALLLLVTNWGHIILVAGLVGLGVYVWLVFFYLPSRLRLHVKTLGELLALTPTQFEVAVGEILRANGYRNVRHVGRSGDLAADLWCRDDKGRSVVVKCKRYSPGTRVGSRDIQGFIGMMSVHHKATCGIFVTTSEFTQPAVDLARRHSVTLMEGRDLTRLMQKTNDAPSLAPERSG
jgi:restriction system protein